jgi:hypothetical protein
MVFSVKPSALEVNMAQILQGAAEDSPRLRLGRVLLSSSCLVVGGVAGLLLAGAGLVVVLRVVSIGLRNLLFIMVTRLLPSTLIITLLLGLFSRTMPVLSHLVGFGPVWFWMATVVLTSRSSRSLVLWLQLWLSISLLLARVLSLCSWLTAQSLAGSYL